MYQLCILKVPDDLATKEHDDTEMIHNRLWHVSKELVEQLLPHLGPPHSEMMMPLSSAIGLQDDFDGTAVIYHNQDHP